MHTQLKFKIWVKSQKLSQIWVEYEFSTLIYSTQAYLSKNSNIWVEYENSTRPQYIYKLWILCSRRSALFGNMFWLGPLMWCETGVTGVTLGYVLSEICLNLVWTWPRWYVVFVLLQQDTFYSFHRKLTEIIYHHKNSKLNSETTSKFYRFLFHSGLLQLIILS